MSERDWYLAKRTMDVRVAQELGLAEARRRARLVQPERRKGLAWHGRWLVCELGYRLVVLGAWLEGYSTPEAQAVRIEQ